MSDVWDWVQEHWEFVVGTLIALLGIAFGLVVYILQRQPKRMDYELWTNLPFVPPSVAALDNKLQVLYGNQIVNEPRIVSIRIKNTGKRAIKADDLATPVTIRYGGRRIVSASITNRYPEGLWNEIMEYEPDDHVRNVLRIRMGLFNPGDWFDVQLVCEGPGSQVEVECRFADQQSPMRNVKPGRDRRWFYGLIFGGIVLGTIVSTLATLGLVGAIIAFIIMLVAVVWAIVMTFRWTK